MKAAVLFVRCLENEGVEMIFGIPGEENLDVMDALLDSDIRFITTRHEQGAAFMADVYGRLTGRAGVCLATLGPGATNLITGVADADMDNAPSRDTCRMPLCCSHSIEASRRAVRPTPGAGPDCRGKRSLPPCPSPRWPSDGSARSRSPCGWASTTTV